ncbi:MAG: PadR family transcriptional regulator [Clostridium sp.]|nr:PadR family transcriptional regulator [Clostridium sp.]
MDKKSNFRRGSVELLVLHLLNQRDYYGYELTQTMKTQTEGIINIPVGSLYPALYKLIDNGYISDYKKQVGKRLTRVYYHLEPSGKERLMILLKDYYTTNRAIQNILNYTGEEESYEKEQQ